VGVKAKGGFCTANLAGLPKLTAQESLRDVADLVVDEDRMGLGISRAIGYVAVGSVNE
jgi:hypothetical protein